MPGDIQVICGSMVGENRQSPASTETPDNLYVTKICYNVIQKLFRKLANNSLVIRTISKLKSSQTLTQL